MCMCFGELSVIGEIVSVCNVCGVCGVTMCACLGELCVCVLCFCICICLNFICM